MNGRLVERPAVEEVQPEEELAEMTTEKIWTKMSEAAKEFNGKLEFAMRETAIGCN